MEHAPHTPKLESYMAGFALSILLTLAAFGITFLHLHSDHHFLSHELMIPIIVALALAQLGVQSYFFLHIGERAKSDFRVIAFIFTLYTVAFIVIGSLWIMYNLNYNMTPDETNQYLHDEN